MGPKKSLFAGSTEFPFHELIVCYYSIKMFNSSQIASKLFRSISESVKKTHGTQKKVILRSLIHYCSTCFLFI